MAEEKKSSKASSRSTWDVIMAVAGALGFADVVDGIQNKAIGCVVGTIGLVVGCGCGALFCYLTLAFSAMGGG